MRKVLFKKWIPLKREKVEGSLYEQLVKGTGCWSDEYTESGIFHQWAASYEEFETGAGNFTVALIELADGKMAEVLPSNLMFVE